jgi:hypothetical protein
MGGVATHQCRGAMMKGRHVAFVLTIVGFVLAIVLGTPTLALPTGLCPVLDAEVNANCGYVVVAQPDGTFIFGGGGNQPYDQNIPPPVGNDDELVGFQNNSGVTLYEIYARAPRRASMRLMATA